MKTLNTTDVLCNLQGEKLKEGDTEITAGLLISNVLSTVQTSNPHRAYQLAKEIATSKSVELKAEDVVFLKEHLAKSTLGALYIGQLIDILESNDKK